MSFLNTAIISHPELQLSVREAWWIAEYFLGSVFIAVVIGGRVIVAQYKGSGNSEWSLTATQAISSVTIFSVLIKVYSLSYLMSRSLTFYLVMQKRKCISKCKDLSHW